MAVQTETISDITTREGAGRSGGRALQAAAPWVGLLAATAAGVGALLAIGTGGDERPATPPPAAVRSAVLPPPQVVVPNDREERTSPAPSCPPLLDGHPSHRVVRTWVCPTR